MQTLHRDNAAARAHRGALPLRVLLIEILSHFFGAVAASLCEAWEEGRCAHLGRLTERRL